MRLMILRDFVDAMEINRNRSPWSDATNPRAEIFGTVQSEPSRPIGGLAAMAGAETGAPLCVGATCGPRIASPRPLITYENLQNL